ncbi:MAG: 3-deoxy-D-manno-octulosonic acid transferase [Deltaproteobacteria bacterium]|nr:3-deoxy-D-manno-octulosonic acid transferase [Deltaproteobacteria bacterium]
MIDIFTVLYDLAWTVLILLTAPWLLFFQHSRWLKRLRPPLTNIPISHKPIWIHALSVGEIISALPVVKTLQQAYPFKKIVFTVTTAQGMEIALKKIDLEKVVLLPMPLDFWWTVRKTVQNINPSVFILVETDIWPGLITRLHRRRIPVILINGRISPRTFKSYQRFRRLAKVILNTPDLCLMQSDLDRERLMSIGLPPDKVKAVGNIKFDQDWHSLDDRESSQWRHRLNLPPDKCIWVAGSTHEPEEKILLGIYKRLNHLFPEFILIIAPRRIERAARIQELCGQKGLICERRSRLGNLPEKRYQVLILDTIGELDRVYGIATISFVGGSLAPIGGHNLLEPARFGCPVLFGPHIHNFSLMSELLIDTGGGIMVKDHETLYAVMEELLSSPEKAEQMGAKARAFANMNKGALMRVMAHIKDYMGDHGLAQDL